jgi:hypothetical protein
VVNWVLSHRRDIACNVQQDGLISQLVINEKRPNNDDLFSFEFTFSFFLKMACSCQMFAETTHKASFEVRVHFLKSKECFYWNKSIELFVFLKIYRMSALVIRMFIQLVNFKYNILPNRTIIISSFACLNFNHRLKFSNPLRLMEFLYISYISTEKKKERTKWFHSSLSMCDYSSVINSIVYLDLFLLDILSVDLAFYLVNPYIEFVHTQFYIFSRLYFNHNRSFLMFYSLHWFRRHMIETMYF